MIEPNSPLARAYGWAAEPLDALLQVSDDLLRTVASGGPNTIHTLAAVLAEREAEARADPAAWADKLAHAPRVELLQQAFGCVPPGFQAALGKLGHKAAPRATYGVLHRACTMPEFMLVLRRRTKISAAFITLLTAPEARRLNARLLSKLAFEDTEGVEALLEALALRARTAPWSEHLDQLSACETPKQLLEWIEYHWEKPFPMPPWAGDDLLEPITDANTLRRVGTEMRNCLAEQVSEVGRGLDYYYVTRGTPRIAVGLHLRAGKWFATQILEARNRRPKAAARRQVLAHLTRAGIPVDIDPETYALIERALGQRDQDDLRIRLI